MTLPSREEPGAGPAVAERLSVFGQLVTSRDSLLARFRGARAIEDLKPLLELEDNYLAVYETANEVWIVNSLYSLNSYFFAPGADSFLHGDTIAAVAAKGPVDLSWNYEAVADFLGLEHLVGDETLARGVRPVPQGAILHWDGRRLSSRTFAFQEFLSPSDGPPHERLIALFLDGLRAGVGARPVTTCSSGLDSRVNLAGLLHLGLRPELCVMGDPESKDVQITRAMAKAFDLRVNHIPLEPREYVEGALAICRTTNGVKALHHWHTYLLATKSGYAPSDPVITGNNGEHVRAAGFDFGFLAGGLDALSRVDRGTLSGWAMGKVWHRRTHMLLRPDELARCAPEFVEDYCTPKQNRRLLGVMPDMPFLAKSDAFVLQQRRRGFQACGLKLMSLGFFPYTAFARKSWVDVGWGLGIEWKLGSRWHRHAVERLCPALLRFPEEKEATRMLTRQRPLAWAPVVNRLYRRPKVVPYMDPGALYGRRDILDLLYDTRGELEGFMPKAVVETILDHHVQTGQRKYLIGILTAMAVWRASLRDGRAGARA
jgi:asparagine synthase (glutamine-hydrolysing)